MGLVSGLRRPGVGSLTVPVRSAARSPLARTPTSLILRRMPAANPTRSQQRQPARLRAMQAGVATPFLSSAERSGSATSSRLPGSATVGAQQRQGGVAGALAVLTQGLTNILNANVKVWWKVFCAARGLSTARGTAEAGALALAAAKLRHVRAASPTGPARSRVFNIKVASAKGTEGNCDARLRARCACQAARGARSQHGPWHG